MDNEIAADLDADVLVIGAGPVGLTTALLLAQWDLSVIVVERRTSRSVAPKAHVINPRSLEIYAHLGLSIDELRRHATLGSDDKVSRFVSRLAARDYGSVPFEEQDQTHTPYPRMNLAQPRLEDILRDRLAITPGLELRQGVTWISSFTEADVVTSVTAAEDGTETTIRTSFVVAADGANSPVRRSLGIEMTGAPDTIPCVAITFQAGWRDLVADRPAMFYWAVGPQRPGVFLAYDIDQTWAYFILGAPELPSEAECREIVVDAVGTPAAFDITHISSWDMTAQVADRFREGRIFLAGDAAHRFPPSGGLGLNTGIQDAHNLAWKIAAISQGWGDDALLDTYDSERRPVAEVNTAQSMKNAEAMIGLLDLKETASQDTVDIAVAEGYDAFNSLGMQLGYSYGPDAAPLTVSTFTPTGRPGDRMPHAWLRDGGEQRSTLDLLSPTRHSLLTFDPSAWSGLSGHVSVVGLDVLSVPDEWRSLVRLKTGSALLVRPDGHIVEIVADGDHAALDRLLGAAALRRGAARA